MGVSGLELPERVLTATPEGYALVDLPLPPLPSRGTVLREEFVHYRYLRWRSAAKTPMWGADLLWYMLVGYLGEICNVAARPAWVWRPLFVTKLDEPS